MNSLQLTPKDIEDGKKIADAFEDLSELSKTISLTTILTLRYKEIADASGKSGTGEPEESRISNNGE